MNINPLVSIIIPTYNRAHFISETLDSILAQKYNNWECIIVDDGSIDNSEFVISKYVELDSRFHFYHRPDDRIKGANSCRNYGFELSKGEYVNWFDSDDIMLDNFIIDRIQSFQERTDFVICSGYYWCPQNDEKSIMDLCLKTNLFKDYVLWNLEIITDSILFKREFLTDKSLFLSKIKRGQETEFFSRLFYKVDPLNYVIISKPLFLYRQHSESKTFKNNYYVHSYKESQSFIAIANLRRSIDVGDSELIDYYYKGLIEYYFSGLRNNHYKNSAYILKKLTPQLFEINKQIAVKFYLIGCFFLIIKRGSYKIERYFKKYKLID